MNSKRKREELKNIQTILPLEALILIMQLLPIKDLLSLRLVNKLFRDQIQYDWKYILKASAPISYLPLINSRDTSSSYFFTEVNADFKKALSPSYAVNSLSAVEKKARALFTYLWRVDLERLKEEFPDFSSIEDILSYFHPNDLQRDHRDHKFYLDEFAKRLWVNADYQLCLDHLYSILSEAPSSTTLNLEGQAEDLYLIHSPTMRAVLFNQSLEKMKEALELNGLSKLGDDTVGCEYWENPLSLAIRMGNINQVKSLIALGADCDIKVKIEFINDESDDENEVLVVDLLVLAVYYNRIELFPILIKACGYDLNAQKYESNFLCEKTLKVLPVEALTQLLFGDYVNINFTEWSTYPHWPQFVKTILIGGIDSQGVLPEKIKPFLTSSSTFQVFSDVIAETHTYNLLAFAAHYNLDHLYKYFSNNLFADQNEKELATKEACKQVFIAGDMYAPSWLHKKKLLKIEYLKELKALPDLNENIWRNIIRVAISGSDHSLLHDLLNVSTAALAGAEQHYFITAALHGCATTMQVLVDFLDQEHLSELEVELPQGEHHTPLKAAISRNHLEIVKIIIKKGAQINIEVLELALSMLQQNRYADSLDKIKTHKKKLENRKRGDSLTPKQLVRIESKLLKVENELSSLESLSDDLKNRKLKITQELIRCLLDGGQRAIIHSTLITLLRNGSAAEASCLIQVLLSQCNLSNEIALDYIVDPLKLAINEGHQEIVNNLLNFLLVRCNLPEFAKSALNEVSALATEKVKLSRIMVHMSNALQFVQPATEQDQDGPRQYRP